MGVTGTAMYITGDSNVVAVSSGDVVDVSIGTAVVIDITDELHTSKFYINKLTVLDAVSEDVGGMKLTNVGALACVNCKFYSTVKIGVD